MRIPQIKPVSGDPTPAWEGFEMLRGERNFLGDVEEPSITPHGEQCAENDALVQRVGGRAPHESTNCPDIPFTYNHGIITFDTGAIAQGNRGGSQ